MMMIDPVGVLTVAAVALIVFRLGVAIGQFKAEQRRQNAFQRERINRVLPKWMRT